MAAQTIQYPLTKFHFKVDLGDNKGDLSFQEVTGLEMTREKAEYRGGMDQSFIKQQIPGMKTFGELTLKRGTFAGNNDFFEWWNGSAQDKAPSRQNLNIRLLNAAGNAVMTWKVANAFPTKVTSTDLNAQNNEIAIETLVLAHEGIELEANK